MKLELIEFKCDSCGSVFEAPGFSENSYGEFLLRSKRGALAYLNAIDDLTYKEVDRLLAQIPETSRLSAIDRAKLLRRVYGRAACDPDNDGSPFEIGLLPSCPNCHLATVSSWTFKSSPVLIDIEIPLVAHVEWEQLSGINKIARLQELRSE